MYIPNLSVVCFFICLSYFIFDCALLLFCAQAWHGKTLSSRNDPIFFCSLHWRNLSSYNKITTTHFKQIRFWWKNLIKFRGKVYSNFFKFVQQLFFFECGASSVNSAHCSRCVCTWMGQIQRTHFTAGYSPYNCVTNVKQTKKYRLSCCSKPLRPSFIFGTQIKIFVRAFRPAIDSKATTLKILFCVQGPFSQNIWRLKVAPNLPI